MRDFVRPGLVLVLALMAAPGFAQKVTVDWDRDYDRSKTETYAWHAPKVPVPSDLMHQRIVNAVNYWLTMRGKHEVKPDQNPDVIVTYNASATNEVVVTADYYGYGYGARWGGGMGTSTARSHTYTKGTLVFEVWEAKAKNLVFRATATDTVDAKPEKNEKKINKAVEKIIEEFDKQLEKEAKKTG